MLWELLFIFFARTMDMCLGTMRHLFAMRGLKSIAALVGFFEILIYTVALALVISAHQDMFRLLVFAVGYSSGIALGVWIEDHLALGYRVLHVNMDPADGGIISELREMGFAVTSWEASGREGPRLVLFLFLKRRVARRVAALVRDRAPGCFIVLTEPKLFLGGLIRQGTHGFGAT